MEAPIAKKLIEKGLQYEEVKRLAVKIVQHASPQTAVARRCARSGANGAGR